MNPQSLPNGTQQRGLATRVPEKWNLYHNGFWHPRTKHMSQHAKDSAIPFTLHTPWFGGQFGRPALFLHEGPSKKDTKIAAIKLIKYHNPFTKAYWAPMHKNNFRVLLHAKAAGAPFKIEACQPIDVACKPAMHVGGRAFAFSLDSPGVGGHAQSFEWRQSNGQEVRELHSGPEWMDKAGLAFGWVLVWLNSPNTAARRGAAAARPPKQGGFRAGLADKASAFMSGVEDGEVVAAWAEGNMKGSKLGLFSFHGSGTARLGEDFMLVAVMTVMQIYEIQVAERQAKATSNMNTN